MTVTAHFMLSPGDPLRLVRTPKSLTASADNGGCGFAAEDEIYDSADDDASDARL